MGRAILSCNLRYCQLSRCGCSNSSFSVIRNLPFSVIRNVAMLFHAMNMTKHKHSSPFNGRHVASCSSYSLTSRATSGASPPARKHFYLDRKKSRGVALECTQFYRCLSHCITGEGMGRATGPQPHYMIYDIPIFHYVI